MKFDEKYSKKLEAVVAGTVTTDEEESMGMPPGGGDSQHPSSAKSPIKIASILEEKITRRNSRASNSNNSVSPSPRSPRGPSRLRRQAEKAGLSRLSIPGEIIPGFLYSPHVCPQQHVVQLANSRQQSGHSMK